MKIKFVISVLFLFSILFQPMSLYAKWHFETFSDGFFYTLLNLTYIPHDYYQQIGGIWIDTDKSKGERLYLNHRYKGKYGVYVVGEAVRNKNHNISATMNCSDKIIELESSSSKITDLNRKAATSLLIGTYNVGDMLPNEIECSISINEQTKGQFFIFIKKFRHY